MFSHSWWQVSQEGQESPLGALVGDSVVSIVLPPARCRGSAGAYRTWLPYRVFDVFGLTRGF